MARVDALLGVGGDTFIRLMGVWSMYVCIPSNNIALENLRNLIVVYKGNKG